MISESKIELLESLVKRAQNFEAAHQKASDDRPLTKNISGGMFLFCSPFLIDRVIDGSIWSWNNLTSPLLIILFFLSVFGFSNFLGITRKEKKIRDISEIYYKPTIEEIRVILQKLRDSLYEGKTPKHNDEKKIPKRS